MNFKRILYTSRARTPFSDEDVWTLSSTSAERNRELDITGTLLFSNQEFMQCLEGPTDAVTALMERIARDPRHTDIVYVLVEPARTRLFGDWGMGLLTVAPLAPRCEPENDLGPDLGDHLRHDPGRTPERNAEDAAIRLALELGPTDAIFTLLRHFCERGSTAAGRRRRTVA